MTEPLFGCFSIADAIQITKGRLFAPLDPFNPRNDFDIEYIAHSLSLQCRWMGGTSNLANGDPLFYSVAQHSCYVADLAQVSRKTLVPDYDWDAKGAAYPGYYGLMHDASEAFLCDIPRPLKPKLIGYYDYEADLMSAISGHHEVPMHQAIISAVKKVDNWMIYWERDEMIGVPEESYSGEAEQHPGTLIRDVIPDFFPWSPKVAKDQFLMRYEKLAADNRWEPSGYSQRGYGIRKAA